MSALLLDTHVLLWWLLKPQKLSRKAYALIERGDVAVSVISLWEVLIKADSGKLVVLRDHCPIWSRSKAFASCRCGSQHVMSAAAKLEGRDAKKERAQGKLGF